MNNEIYGRVKVILENDRGRKKSAGTNNYSPGIGEAKFSLGLHN